MGIERVNFVVFLTGIRQKKISTKSLATTTYCVTLLLIPQLNGVFNEKPETHFYVKVSVFTYPYEFSSKFRKKLDFGGKIRRIEQANPGWDLRAPQIFDYSKIQRYGLLKLPWPICPVTAITVCDFETPIHQPL